MWYFLQIVPCGLEGREATSLEAQGVKDVSVDRVAGMFVDAFLRRLNADFACGKASAGVRGERVEGVYRIHEEDVLGVDG